MGLESAEFISDLIATWPLPTDRRREGDDHLRMIKSAIKNTFPNINAAVTATVSQLNDLPNLSTKGHITELKKHIVPKGTIVMWSGATNEIPEGWALCNGQTVTDFGTTPDLRGRFILAWSGANPVGQAEGDNTVTTSSGGAHEHEVNGHALTVAQLPQHSHRIYACAGAGTSGTVKGFGGGDVAIIGDDNNLPKQFTSVNSASRQIVESTGTGNAHSHGMQSAGGHTHQVTFNPKHYVLAFIIKTTDYQNPAS